ncbi:phage protein [Streptococcus pseudoporcinus]|uniref:Phage protein n=1 Tax=Streptococcus pseudoporcinus TaxID=361101 RepID=A0A4U9XKF5_9STRE|nr:head-tail connector protein [Streptococcus pseudoporcinus]VTS13499.1 phage protein [Streptococcus pseudoporcinus]VTS20047.1 phage protein [Streptococcus pseudoporcinus]
MTVSPELLDKVKVYCKIDYDFEDEIVEMMILSAQNQICFAIEKDSTPDTFANFPQFELAVMKQVKEEYDHRGLSADSMRYPLANGVLNIIHQLRLRGEQVL